ncbi:hypothetical protein MCEMSEM22_02326 [Comamonadaceae bacterium]
MPVRVSKSWRLALRAIAKIQLSNSFSDWGFMWAAYTRIHRKAVREIKRQMLSKLEQEARAEATEMVQQVAHNMMLSGKPTSAASQELQIAEITAELRQEKMLSKKERE